MGTSIQFGNLPAGLPAGALVRPLGKSGLPAGAMLRALKPVLHATDDVEALRASAERQTPALRDAVRRATEDVPGAKLEAVRDAKDSDRITDKAARQGIAPSQIGDIAAAKVTVPDQASAERVVKNLHGELPVQKAEGNVTGKAGKNGVRQVQTTVRTGQPGEPVQHAEVLLQTPEMNDAADSTHEDYRKAQELRAAGKEDEAAALEEKIAASHDDAEMAAQNRLRKGGRGQSPEQASGASTQAEAPGAKGDGDAIPKRSAKSVLQRSPQEDGSAGSGRGRVEPGEQGQGSAGAGETKAAEQKKSGQRVAWKAGRQSTPVQVKDADGNWVHGTLDHYNPGFNGAKASARVTLANGFHMRNVSPDALRMAADNTQASKGGAWIGVDLDGTLAHYDGYKGPTYVGAPIPAMVDRVKQMLKDGKDVRIFSARVADDPGGKAQAAIEAWAEKHIGQKLPITNVKDDKMSHLFDDRATSVQRNTGAITSQPQSDQPGVSDFGNKLLHAFKTSSQRRRPAAATA